MISPSSMQESENSKPVNWDNPEGWDGDRGMRGIQDGGTRVQLWLIHVNVWKKLPQYCKVISLQLKINKLILKRCYR